MEYKENVLCYEDYCELRESVGWLLSSKEQTQKALINSLYTVIAVKGIDNAILFSITQNCMRSRMAHG